MNKNNCQLYDSGKKISLISIFTFDNSNIISMTITILLQSRMNDPNKNDVSCLSYSYTGT
jgi:hypothetical protein